jgi:polyphosphate kinase 2 (PPK2 family)
MAKWVAKLQEQEKAPKRVILYLEGLDCSGKSSTGGLICQALEQCGYGVMTAQHNRPPSAEQRAKPWMDRGRFEYPDDMYASKEECPEYAAVVWDRGPAGDFVYGNLDKLPLSEKLKRYKEFREYDEACHQNETLFCKILFVTDKDSIAATLGKRLAQRQIARDLHSWLDANSSPNQERPGLDEIEHHIDPTDFIAFNKLQSNLAKFTEVARNTDVVGHVGSQKDSAMPLTYTNPWLVVCTSNRHSARLGILRAFQKQLKQYVMAPPQSVHPIDPETESLITPGSRKSVRVRPVPNNIVEEREHGISLRAVFQTFLLALILYMYAYFTWNFDFEMVT